MALLNSDDLYLVDDYYGLDEYEHEFAETAVQNDMLDDDDDDDDDDAFADDFDLGLRKTDTSAFEARNGKDIQGIPWERMNFSREHYRDSRLKLYKNYESVAHSRDGLHKEFMAANMGSKFYDFQFNTRLVKSTIVHFQAASFIFAAFSWMK